MENEMPGHRVNVMGVYAWCAVAGEQIARMIFEDLGLAGKE
jgi:hypothetical protein